MLTPDALEELLHSAHLSVWVDVFAIRYSNADEWHILGRAHGNAPDPIALSKEMVSSEVGNEGAVFLLESADAAQNFWIEIHQAEPEYVLLLVHFFMKLQQFRENAVAASGVDEPVRLERIFLLGGISHRDGMQTAVVAKTHAGHSAVDYLHAVFHVAPAHLAIERKPVDLKREQRGYSGSFVDDIGAIRGIIDLGLVIISEAVFWKVVFDQVRTEAEFEKEIDGDLDEGFAHNRAIFVRTFDNGDFEVRETHPQVSRREMTRRPASHNQHVGCHEPPTLPIRQGAGSARTICNWYRAKFRFHFMTVPQHNIWPPWRAMVLWGLLCNDGLLGPIFVRECAVVR